jgi:hypothetical protein
MVLTVPVRTGKTHPRRSFLGAAGLVTGSAVFVGGAAVLAGGSAVLAGCSSDEPNTRPPVDSDTLRALAAESLYLAGRLDAALAAQPGLSDRLTPLRDAHREHAAALARSFTGSAQPSAPVSASASAGTGSDAAVLKALATAERGAAERATAACAAVAAHNAPLVGIIAAARASHAEALS